MSPYVTCTSVAGLACGAASRARILLLIVFYSFASVPLAAPVVMHPENLASSA